MNSNHTLDRILREQREAAATLPGPGGMLGVSDWVGEEVLVLTEQQDQNRSPVGTPHANRGRAR